MRFGKYLIRAAALLLSGVLLSSCAGEVKETTAAPDAPESSDVPAAVEPAKKRIAFTFDDGPQHYNDEETKAVVDEFKKYGGAATFFVVGTRVAGGDAVKYAAANGCEIGIHGYTHENYYDKCSDEVYKSEIDKTLAAIHKELPDYEVKLLRPVGGRITPERAAASPYSIIMWNIDSDDWNNKYHSGDSDAENQAKLDRIVENVISKAADGDIVLMHDIYTNTFDALCVILERLDREGFEFVTVSELIGEDIKAGETYYRK